MKTKAKKPTLASLQAEIYALHATIEAMAAATMRRAIEPAESLDGRLNLHIKNTVSDICDLREEVRRLARAVPKTRFVVFTTTRYAPKEFRVPASAFRPGPMHTVLRYEEE